MYMFLSILILVFSFTSINWITLITINWTLSLKCLSTRNFPPSDYIVAESAAYPAMGEKPSVVNPACCNTDLLSKMCPLLQ